MFDVYSYAIPLRILRPKTTPFANSNILINTHFYVGIFYCVRQLDTENFDKHVDWW